MTSFDELPREALVQGAGDLLRLASAVLGAENHQVTLSDGVVEIDPVEFATAAGPLRVLRDRVPELLDRSEAPNSRVEWLLPVAALRDLLEALLHKSLPFHGEDHESDSAGVRARQVVDRVRGLLIGARVPMAVDLVVEIDQKVKIVEESGTVIGAEVLRRDPVIP